MLHVHERLFKHIRTDTWSHDHRKLYNKAERSGLVDEYRTSLTRYNRALEMVKRK